MSYSVPFSINLGAANSGLTITATIIDTAGATVLSGLTGAVEIGATGIYRWYYASFSDGFVGYVEFLSGATVKAMAPVSPSDSSIPVDQAAITALTASMVTLASYVDTEIAAIKARTDLIPASPADAASVAALASSLTTLSGYVDTEVGTILAAVDTEVGAIKTQTDQLVFVSGDVQARLSSGGLTALWGALTSALTAAGSIGKYIFDKLALIGSGTAVTAAPVAVSGDISIVRGDDYANADSRALEWTNAAGTWPDLTSATITLTASRQGSTAFTKAGTVVTPTGAGQKVRFELTAADTALDIGGWTFDIQATLFTNGRKVTLAFGRMKVRRDMTV